MEINGEFQKTKTVVEVFNFFSFFFFVYMELKFL